MKTLKFIASLVFVILLTSGCGPSAQEKETDDLSSVKWACKEFIQRRYSNMDMNFDSLKDASALQLADGSYTVWLGATPAGRINFECDIKTNGINWQIENIRAK